MTRRVVFAGGIQAKALAKAYRLDIAVDRDVDVFFIGAESIGREAAHRVIAAADVVVTDVTDTGDTVPDRLISPSAHRIGVPVVLADFLWPFAGRPHPRNAPADGLAEGPYPASFGDSFLDRMIEDGVPEDEAVASYLALDVAEAVDLDGMLQRRLSVQAHFDGMTGFGIADFIEAEFRAQNLFATRDRFRLPLLRHVAAGVFARMGERPGAEAAIAEAEFPSGAMPIHPAILRHFGMAAPLPDHRYPVLDEGMFSFEQYCRRYLRFEWNSKLHAAIALADHDPSAAIPALRLALETSPGSRAGQAALEQAERAVSDSSMLPPIAIAPPEAAPEPTPVPMIHDPLVPETHSGAWEGLPSAEPDDLPQEDSGEEAELDEEGLGPGLPVFGRSVFGDLHLPGISMGEDPSDRLQSISFSSFAPVPAVTDPVAEHELAEILPPQQDYVELPHGFADYEEATAGRMPSTPTQRYTQLAPSRDLIEVLPRMLSGTRSQLNAVESPFSAMPETMPPPPLRPILPPELQPETARRGLMARLFGGKS